MKLSLATKLFCQLLIIVVAFSLICFFYYSVHFLITAFSHVAQILSGARERLVQGMALASVANTYQPL